jgi:hypothetical protein
MNTDSSTSVEVTIGDESYVMLQRPTSLNHGYIVWDSAIGFAKYLAQAPKQAEAFASKAVLEFGCGCGLLGCVLHRRGASQLTLTDLREVVDNAAACAAANGVPAVRLPEDLADPAATRGLESSSASLSARGALARLMTHSWGDDVAPLFGCGAAAAAGVSGGLVTAGAGAAEGRPDGLASAAEPTRTPFSGGCSCGRAALVERTSLPARHLALGPYDFILGTDTLYSVRLVPALLRSIALAAWVSDHWDDAGAAGAAAAAAPSGGGGAEASAPAGAVGSVGAETTGDCKCGSAEKRSSCASSAALPAGADSSAASLPVPWALRQLLLHEQARRSDAATATGSYAGSEPTPRAAAVAPELKTALAPTPARVSPDACAAVKPAAPSAPRRKRCTIYLGNEVRCTAAHAAFQRLAARLFDPFKQLTRRQVGAEVADSGVLIFEMRVRLDIAGPADIDARVAAFVAEEAAAASAAH